MGYELPNREEWDKGYPLLPDRPDRARSQSPPPLETIPEGNESEEESAEEPEGPVSQQTEEEVYLKVEKQILEEADCEAHSNLTTDVDDQLLYKHNSVEDEVWDEAFPQQFNYQVLMEEATDLREHADKPETITSEPIMEYYYTPDASKLIWRAE